MPKVSVIIPVYNTERFVGECIESILSQTMGDFELILVDDGSPDRSGEICDEYAARDSRIRVIHKPNGGVSSARNAGIDASTGTWLCFCDSDDTMPLHALAALVGVAESHHEAQLVVGKTVAENDVIWCPKEEDCGKVHLVQQDIKNESLSKVVGWCVWGKIVSREIVVQNNLYFDTSLIAGEDPLWNFFLSKHLDTVAYCNEVVYSYRQDNPTSANKQPDKTKFYCSVLRLAQIVAENLCDPESYGEISFVLHFMSVHQLIRQWEYIRDREMVRKAILENRRCVLRSRVSWVVKYAAIYLSLPYWLISNHWFNKLFYNQPVKLLLSRKS